MTDIDAIPAIEEADDETSIETNWSKFYKGAKNLLKKPVTYAVAAGLAGIVTLSAWAMDGEPIYSGPIDGWDHISYSEDNGWGLFNAEGERNILRAEKDGIQYKFIDSEDETNIDPESDGADGGNDSLEVIETVDEQGSKDVYRKAGIGLDADTTEMFQRGNIAYNVLRGKIRGSVRGTIKRDLKQYRTHTPKALKGLRAYDPDPVPVQKASGSGVLNINQDEVRDNGAYAIPFEDIILEDNVFTAD